MKSFDWYFDKKVKVLCTDGQVFSGAVVGFGGSVHGEEEYGRAENFISVYTGDASYVLFESEINDIVEV